MEKILQILAKSPPLRTPENINQLFDYFSNSIFFQDLIKQNESEEVCRELLKLIQLESFIGENCIKSGIYIVLSGSLLLKSADLETMPKIFRKNQGMLQIQEDIWLEAGALFGEIEKNKFYDIFSSQICQVGYLSNESFNKVIHRNEILLEEKIDFLKELKIFKHWSRLAIKNASIAFEKRFFRKGNIVYKEKDPVTDVFIVSNGEFKFTQKYAFDSMMNVEEDYNFRVSSELKRNRLKKNKNFRELQVVIKQKNDIFGFNEIFAKKSSREYTCTCMSPTGELYVINEKEFHKRLSHPETMRILEEQDRVFSKWADLRVCDLKFLEGYKNEISHTPKSKIKITRRSVENKLITVHQPVSVTPEPKLPAILGNIIKNRNNVSSVLRERSFVMFPTELRTESSHRKIRFPVKF